MTSSMLALLVLIAFVIIYGLFRFFSKNPDGEEIVAQEENVEEANNAALDNLEPHLREIYERALDPTKYSEATFYTLTRCVHCGKLEKYLEANSIPFTKVLLDDFQGSLRQNILKKLRSYNERGSFPTLVSQDEKVTVGFRQWDVYDKFMRFSTNPELLAKYEESLKK